MQAQSQNYSAGIFLQRIHPSSTEEPIGLKAFACYQELTPASVDTAIDFEMKKVMAKYAAEEENFVEQKLIENPVASERRPSRSGSDSNSSSRDILYQQKLESCRKSRFNNKIKKAKSKFRHRFITMKLAQNAAALECIRNMVVHAEAKLRSTGCSDNVLKKLRNTMGVDKMEIDNLSEIRKQLGNISDV